VPIYEQTYRRYEARAPLRKVRFWPITREALRLVLARRWFLILLIGGWLQFLVRVIQVYVVTRFPEAGRVLPVDGRLFGEFLGIQLMPALLVTIFSGAGLIANDLRTGAILVYLSRPLTRRDYVLGKMGVLAALNLSVTLQVVARHLPDSPAITAEGQKLTFAQFEDQAARDLNEFPVAHDIHNPCSLPLSSAQII